tara:strand:- start:2393 stop:3334 length:942 start_codon:yes stop_codon:yes gene_type:complete
MTSYRKNMAESYQQVRERELTPKELKRREEIAKELPDKEFKDRYGKDWMSVKMATATKMAKAESLGEGKFTKYSDLLIKLGRMKEKGDKQGEKNVQKEIDKELKKLGIKENNELSELSTQDALVVRAKQLARKKNDLKARIEIANKIEIKSPSLFKYYRELEKRGDKSSPAVKKFDKQLMSALAKKFGQDVAKKTEKALKEELKEDGHEDVPSAVRQCKTVIEDANEIMNKLNSMSEQELPSWWTNKLAVASNSMNKMRDYLLNPSEVSETMIKEAEGDLEDLKNIVKELEKASQMHLGQSKRIAKHIGMMEK